MAKVTTSFSLLMILKKTWVYFFKQKSEVFETLKKFKAAVEKEDGHQIKVMRFDRSREFTSEEIMEFCKFGAH